ncbi:MAG: heparin lyase I family protein [Anaerolineaceae bacterium]|nr:heparin lyase I family protein [Anaerolineaceae bacterium]
MRLCIQVSVALLLFISACNPVLPEPDEVEYLRAVVAENLLPYATVDVPSRENIQILDDGGLEMVLFPGQSLQHGGIRAEISVDYPYQEGDTVRYQWRIRLPEDFPPDPQNRWWVIAQWHDQPDRTQGETWDNFPSNSPPVLFGYGNLVGQDVLSVSYGPTQVLAGLIPIRRGEWITLTAEITWSQRADGALRVFLDDDTKPIITTTGMNMLNGFQHYFKLGMYRHPDINSENHLQIGDVYIEKLETQND